MDSVNTYRAPESAPVDLDNLLARCMGRIELAEKILQTFHNTLDKDVDRLEEALRETNADEVAHFAHRIKGASLAVAAHDLTECADSIERTARSGQLETVSADLERLKRERSRLAEARTTLVTQSARQASRRG